MKKFAASLLAALVLCAFSGCGSSGSSTPAQNSSDAASSHAASQTPESAKVRLILDWTPNTNHTGIYAAQELGYYADAGIDLEILQPPEDGALSLLGSGNAQYAISFQEEMAAAIASDTPMPILTVAAITEHNTSGIISLKERGINSPKDLAGKRFATWDTPLVNAIMRTIIENDGGNFESMQMIPLSVTDVVSALQVDIDAVWIYAGWDGVAVQMAGLDTNYMAFADINPIFDFYTPVLAVNSDYAAANVEQTIAFMAATRKGYEYAMANPTQSAEILLKAAPELDRDLVMASQEYLSAQYVTGGGEWGIIDQERWSAFYKWMYAQDLLENNIGEAGFTNAYLDGSAAQ